MKEIKLFETQIDGWGMPITMRAYDAHDAEELARILFKIPTNVKITAVPEEPEPVTVGKAWQMLMEGK